MGWKEGDPYPCTGREPHGAVIQLDENGDPVNGGVGNAIEASACFADWYYGTGQWMWRDGPPAEPEPQE